MTVNRLTIVLPQDEYSALLDDAMEDLRTPAEQARHIIRKALKRKQRRLVEKAAEDEAEHHDQ
jgi:hypothetical protein